MGDAAHYPRLLLIGLELQLFGEPDSDVCGGMLGCSSMGLNPMSLFG
ncbi:hypothetical protein C4K04_6448 [Pseudomonas chlororaphis]|uniref:Uncharacterized protein n=1 Tax=Pseudomonas chlororaphis TaxID=587753 RepID=A0A3G7U0Q1_9PSED|nr:hypothetical protein C4K04_6448 [Pseudomonas chlororaphis]